MVRYKFQLILFTCLILFIGCSSDSKSVKLNPSSLDFGNVNLGDYAELSLDVMNKFGKDVIVTNIDLTGSADFYITSGASLPLSLLKGTTQTITFRFEPSSSGQLNSLITILHDASTKAKTAELTGIGVPVPRIEVPVTSHDFGLIVNNSTVTQEFEIGNIGTADLIIHSLDFIGAGAVLYSVISGGSIPVTINPGVTHKIEVQFAPLTDGTYLATLQIGHNAINESTPLDISLEGDATAHAPEIFLSETSPWDFSTQPITNSKILDLEIESNGLHDLTVTSITFATGTEFSLDSVEDSNGNVVNLPQVVAVGDKIIAKIKFSPTAVTNYNDTMSIVHDAINETSPLDIAVEGEGTNPITQTFNYTGNIVNWTVPAGVTTLEIEVWGSEGGLDGSSSRMPGKGARMKGTFTVTPGDTLKILVGQKGQRNGGGGGSYVCDSSNNPLIIAGAGGGSAGSTDSNTKDGQITTAGGAGAAGGGAGGTNGNGGSAGSSSWNAGAGGGLLTDGANGSSVGGKAFVNGGAGGSSGYGVGGFGGGGGGSGYVVGGGGGGYSGGGGGGNSSAGVGGGGGSINNGTNQSNNAGVRSNNGEVQITY